MVKKTVITKKKVCVRIVSVSRFFDAVLDYVRFINKIAAVLS